MGVSPPQGLSWLLSQLRDRRRLDEQIDALQESVPEGDVVAVPGVEDVVVAQQGTLAVERRERGLLARLWRGVSGVLMYLLSVLFFFCFFSIFSCVTILNDDDNGSSFTSTISCFLILISSICTVVMVVMVMTLLVSCTSFVIGPY